MKSIAISGWRCLRCGYWQFGDREEPKPCCPDRFVVRVSVIA